MTLSVRKTSYGYAVFDGGERVSGVLADFNRAEARKDDILRQRGRRKRPCITCGTTFLSEGAHHRMCNLCRTRGTDSLPCPVTLPRGQRGQR